MSKLVFYLVLALVACLVVALLSRRQRSLKEDYDEFEQLREEWIRQLEKLPGIAKAEWGDEGIQLLEDEGIPFLFKEFHLTSEPKMVDLEGESSELIFHPRGYGVAVTDAAGAWRPTDWFFAEKDSPEAALAEMRRLRVEGK